MILILGGTTEGRRAVQALDESGATYYYSTRDGGQDVTLRHGVRLQGALDAEAMEAFIRAKGIRLVVDAAHPFAAALHANAAQAAARCGIPRLRYERIYPPRDPALTWCRDYADALAQMQQAAVRAPLVLTGVQSIAPLRPLWHDNARCRVRILDRDASRLVAHKAGIPPAQLCYYRADGDETALLRTLRPDAVLLKESGTTGGFGAKVQAARALGIRVFVVKRPPLPPADVVVDGPHGLRRAVEKMLPEFFALHTGLTTGTCATAAAVRALTHLLSPGGQGPSPVPVTLPDGETIHVPARILPIPPCPDGTPRALAETLKDAGHDPDITDGIAIRAEVSLHLLPPGAPPARQASTPPPDIELRGGEGVGTVTLPGLGIPVGHAAINDGPRQMLRHNLLATLQRHGGTANGVQRITATLHIPGGAQLARRTFNPRLGIEGGLSVIGTSGIVRPFSTEAFIHSIRKAMEVAAASHAERIVISSGAKSENAVRARYPYLPAQAFVHYGNFVGQALQAAQALGIRQLTLAVMIGKAVKLAEGHLDTHSRHTTMDLGAIAALAREAGCDEQTLSAIGRITLARQLWHLLPADRLPAFCRLLADRCHRHCAPLAPDAALTVLLVDEDGATHG